MIKKVKKTVSWTYVISDLKSKEIVGTFYEKELKKTSQKEFRAEKVIKRKEERWKEEKVINYRDKYSTTQEFNKLTSENFTARLKQANLPSKSDIANFVKKTDFDNKLKNLNKNELNKLSKKVKAILTKGLTKDLINKFSILNGARCFSSGIF